MTCLAEAAQSKPSSKRELEVGSRHGLMQLMSFCATHGFCDIQQTSEGIAYLRSQVKKNESSEVKMLLLKNKKRRTESADLSILVIIVSLHPLNPLLRLKLCFPLHVHDFLPSFVYCGEE